MSMCRLILAWLLLIVFGQGCTTTTWQDSVDTLRHEAEQGNANAQMRLALMYTLGNGVPRDETEAIRWYRQAAEHEVATAQFLLGMLYAEGKGESHNTVDAVMWYRKAAEQGHEDAQ